MQWNQANKNKTEFRFSASLLKKYGDWESAHGSYFYLWNEHWYMMRSNLLVLNGKSFAEAGRLALEEREVWTYDRGEQMKLRKIEEDINEAIDALEANPEVLKIMCLISKVNY